MTKHHQILLERYLDLLLKWNQKINLTAAQDLTTLYTKHVEDCLSLVPFVKDAKRLVDLGSGAGFPGLVLKIALPALEVVLVEATQKKVSFLATALATLGLLHISAVQGRAESKQVQEQLERFDVVVSRATWSLKDFLPIASPYCAQKGKIIAMKGPKAHEELKEAETVITKEDFFLSKEHFYTLSSGERRSLLFFEKR